MENKLYIFEKALSWIKKNSIDGNGIIITSKNRHIYPEVSGYLIPTLLEWGEKELASSYAMYLCSIQKSDGSWYGCDDSHPYVFDTAQILKGLISIRGVLPLVDEHVIRGCDWLLSNILADGRMTSPNTEAWGDDKGFCSELIHLYCLSPLMDAAEIYDKKAYMNSVDDVLGYYKKHHLESILDFSLFSHFYAYVIEGLVDVGETELARKAMLNLSKYQNRKGIIPGLKDVSWLCSTGLLQFALIWYKLGELEKGNRLFYRACELQNDSGGWYGSYDIFTLKGFLKRKRKAYYFPDEEISWANKFFLDALAQKEILEFERQADTFLNNIDEHDGRFILIEKEIRNYYKKKNKGLKICDVGCGKGRYLRKLIKLHPGNDYSGVDISKKVTNSIDFTENIRQGRMTQLPFDNEIFDLVYVCEALEHAINLEGALSELFRVTKGGGRIVIVDKPIEKLGQLELYEWEQWIDSKRIKEFVSKKGGKIGTIQSVPYEDRDDGLFKAWLINTKG